MTKDKKTKQDYINQGIGVGLAVGVAFGVVFKNIGLGIALGLAIGAGIGSVRFKKAELKDQQQDGTDEDQEN